ncbi:hypothetical protein GQ44DRAFT_569975, partial [Phaeosphaeriaceae sp. PMI808]
YDIYLGLWTNHSKGSVHGATLTTTRESGALLIAFLAIYVGATGKSFWRLLCLALHRYLSSNEPRDVLHHQRQAIIRNAETPESAMWYLLLLAKAWRKRANNPYRRLGFILILSIAISAAFGVAGVFSSRVTTGTVSEVLLTGKSCRRPGSGGRLDGSDFHALYDPWVSKENSGFLTYARKCYIDGQRDQDCHRFVKPRIPLNITRNAGCPFGNGICRAKSIIVDTGLLNSNMDLGVNLPRKFQFQIRMINECAPLKTEGYTSIHNQTAFPDIPLLRLHYGNGTWSKGNFTNYLYQVPANLSARTYEGSSFTLTNKARYDIGTTHVYDAPEEHAKSGDAKLIPSLQRFDADVGLVFLSSPGIMYTQQIDDPWYAAHTKGLSAINENGKKRLQFWQQDEAVSVLGCTSQFQICTPNATNGWSCQPLHGILGTLYAFQDGHPEFSDEQKNTSSWFAPMLLQSLDPVSIVEWAGESALSAKFSHGSAIAGALPKDQWEKEVTWWASAQATSVQNLFVEFANGPQGLPLEASIPPDTKGEKLICTSQRMTSALYFSFSVLGILLILILGGIIILLNLTLELILDNLRTRKEEENYAWIEWKLNTILQLQRLAYESAGSGTWEKAEDAVPIAMKGEYLIPIDVTDRNHPR